MSTWGDVVLFESQQSGQDLQTFVAVATSNPP